MLQSQMTGVESVDQIERGEREREWEKESKAGTGSNEG